jgi:hypothetical protein
VAVGVRVRVAVGTEVGVAAGVRVGVAVGREHPLSAKALRSWAQL